MLIKALAFSLLSVPAFALSNAVTIQEKSGSDQTNRVLTIPRFFADKEICLYPRPYVGGSAVTYWQVNVKNRWPADANCAGGYAKWALITVELNLTGNGSTVVEFRSDAASASSGSGLNKTQMLDFDAGGGAASWGAKVTAGIDALSASVSARTMISDNHYQLLESGPLRTSVLVREGPDAVSAVTTRTTSFGFRCTANCTSPYDTATWADSSTYYSMRPSFVVTFYSPHTGTGSVEVDYLVDNGWTDRAQDQRLDSFVLYKGGAETTACYTAPDVFVIPFRGRVFETCWSTDPGAVNIDFNRAYVTYSKATPAYGLEYTVGASAIALDVGSGAHSAGCASNSCTFASSDRGETTTTIITPHMGWGQIVDRNGATGGASSILGWVPRWSARYLATYDYTLLPVVLGNAKAIMHAPMHYLEHSTSAIWRSGGTAKAFGKDISLDVRATFTNSGWALDGLNADKVTIPSGSILASGTGMVQCRNGINSNTPCSSFASNAVNMWGWDLAHATNEAWTAYFATGKLVYFEQMTAHAQLVLEYTRPGTAPPYLYGRWNSKGLIYDDSNQIRGTAWPLMHLARVATFAPDGSDEAAYFLEKLNNNLESNEGRFNITNGYFPPVNSSCSGFNSATETSIWRMSRCLYENGGTNPLGIQIDHYNAGATDGSACYGCALSASNDGAPEWMHAYWVLELAHMRDLGFKSAYIHNVAAKHMLHWFGDTAFTGGNPAAGQLYYAPSRVAGDTGYFQTWAALRDAIIRSAPLSLDITSGATSLSLPTVCTTTPDSLDFNNRNSTYWKIGTEVVRLTGNSWDFKTISAVDTSTDRVTTSTAHGRTDGQTVLIRGTTLDNGMIGNALCKVNANISPGNQRNNNCIFWVKVIDTTTLEFYEDAALTQKINLTGGSSAMVVNNCVCTVTRGVLGTTAAAHSQGDSFVDHAVVGYTNLTVDPTGNHNFIYRSALATAVDYDLSDTDEGTGGTIRARRVFEMFNQLMWNQENSGKSASCGNINTCDNPQWGISPRPKIRNLRVVPLSVAARFFYTAPDGNACKVGVSATPFASTDDSGDTSDAQSNPARSTTIGSLTPETTYYYRITCGPSGGAARATGTFTTI